MKSKKAKEFRDVHSFDTHYGYVMDILDVRKAIELAEQESEERAIRAFIFAFCNGTGQVEDHVELFKQKLKE